MPADAPDPFDTLGLSPVFDLDRDTVERAYLALAARLHPDIARGDPEAPARAASANLARQILADPERRAGALLARWGGPTKEADRSLPPGFLAEMMETREAVERAAASGDAAEVARWNHWAVGRRADYAARVGALFASVATAGPAERPQILRDIRTELNAWRYVERLIEQLRPGYDPALADFPDAGA